MSSATDLVQSVSVSGRRVGQALAASAVAVCLLITVSVTASANGVPVQVFLDHLPFKATWEPASNGRGVAVVSANDEQVRVMTQNLPAAPAGQVYYAWLEKVDGGFMAVGALSYNPADGTASINQHIESLPYSENFSWVLVSLESESGAGGAPGAEIALAGRMPNAQALPLTVDETPALLPVTGGSAVVDTSLWPYLRSYLVAGVVLSGLGAALLFIRRLRPQSRSSHPQMQKEEL